jgi:hypothetical protein
MHPMSRVGCLAEEVAAMNEDSPVPEIQDRMRGAAELLTRLVEQPEPLSELRSALDSLDASRFRKVLQESLGDFKPPPDRCDPYVRVIATIVKPPKFVRRCEWVAKRLRPEDGATLAESVASGISAGKLTELLEALGLIKCEWVREDQNEILQVDKFVQGICPPGTF